MSLFPCNACGERKPGKYANATWAWWRADNERTAWRQLLCVDCYILNVQVLEQSTSTDPYNCPACHTDPGDQLDPTYLTCYLPGIGKLNLEMATCAICAAEIRIRGQKGARKLDNRPIGSGGQDPSPQTDEATNVWALLGVTPRQPAS